MCERSPLRLTQTQNRVSRRPRIAEMLHLRSPSASERVVGTEKVRNRWNGLQIQPTVPTENPGGRLGEREREYWAHRVSYQRERMRVCVCVCTGRRVCVYVCVYWARRESQKKVSRVTKQKRTMCKAKGVTEKRVSCHNTKRTCLRQKRGTEKRVT